MKFRGHLSTRQGRILEVFADTLIPATEKISDRPSALGIREKVESGLGFSHPAIIFALRVGLCFLQWSALFYHLGFRPFTSMPEEERVAYLRWWNQKRFLPSRVLFRAMEVHVLTHYYATEQVYRKIGYSLRLPDKTPSSALYGPGLVTGFDQDVSEEVEVCVIGSGAGGAVVAKELAERGHSVVLLEEGGRFDLNDFRTEAIYRSQRMYVDGGITTTVGVPPILLPLGRAIGGTTVINSGTCFRTPAKVFKIWRERYGLNNFSEENLAPYFSAVESTINVMSVPEELIGASGRVIALGLERLGLSGAPLSRNIKGCQGSGLCCFGCPTDGKQSVQLNYIPQALKAGAKLYPFCQVRRIRSQGESVQEVEGVSLVGDKKKIRIRAKVVVVAAGTIGSVLLLKHNRLALASGHLGRHLTLHPAAKALALFEEKLEGWNGVPQSYYSDFLKEEGITFEGVFTPPSLGSTSLLLHGLAHKRVMENYGHVASFGFMIEDTARGTVRRLPDGRPLILYSLKKEDVQKLVKGLAWLTKIFFAAGAKKVYPCIHCLPELNSEADLEKIYRLNLKRSDLEVAAFHPLGTARMGADPKTSVVDEFGRVHEMRNLFIADGSVFPTPLGVNPQVTIMAFATRAAEHIHHKHL